PDGETNRPRGGRSAAICGFSGGFARGRRRLGDRLARPRSLLPGPLGQEGATPDRAVESRPAPAGGELLLEPVEAAKTPAEVVDHVHARRSGRGRPARGSV